ncbi:MAG: four helix bundle protein [Planctomycetaceae bacterium]|nr:four helix bundle protein [Planctomycetaceae bacterium]
MYQSFEDLEVWKRSCQLAVRIYEVMRECRDFGLKDQMQRAAVSIASNIAEGSERSPKDFARFLSIARGSTAELKTQAYIASKIDILDIDRMREITLECQEISKMLFGLKQSLNT